MGYKGVQKYLQFFSHQSLFFELMVKCYKQGLFPAQYL